MKIEVHIERLILDGLPVTAAESGPLHAAVSAELARRLAAGGLADQLRGGGAMPGLNAPPITLSPNDRTDAIGRHIAHSIHAGIGRRE